MQTSLPHQLSPSLLKRREKKKRKEKKKKNAVVAMHQKPCSPNQMTSSLFVSVNQSRQINDNLSRRKKDAKIPASPFFLGSFRPKESSKVKSFGISRQPINISHLCIINADEDPPNSEPCHDAKMISCIKKVVAT